MANLNYRGPVSVCVCVRARACVSLYACIHDSDQWVEASACV